jgi:hypothetical protein
MAMDLEPIFRTTVSGGPRILASFLGHRLVPAWQARGEFGSDARPETIRDVAFEPHNCGAPAGAYLKAMLRPDQGEP